MQDARVQVDVDPHVVLRTPIPLPTGHLPWLITRYQQGATLRILEQDTGCSYSTIRRTLLSAGITLRPPRTPATPTTTNANWTPNPPAG